jgi:TolA-binding protein
MKSAKDVNAADNMFQAAKNYLAVGNKEKAAELFRKVKKDHQTAAIARDIDRWIAEASS